MKSFSQFMEVVENPSRNLKKQAKAASKRVDVDFDGDVDKNDRKYGGDYGEFVPSADGKKKLKTGRVKFATESDDAEQRRKDAIADRKAQLVQLKKEKTNQKSNKQIAVDVTNSTLEKVKNALDAARNKNKDLLDALDDEMEWRLKNCPRPLDF